MPKLIDSEAAKAAIWKARTDATETWEALSHLDEARRQCSAVVQACDRLLAALDALPDASEGRASILPNKFLYGLCPRCGAPGVRRERRPDGNDVCRNEHTYPSADAIMVGYNDLAAQPQKGE